MFSVRCHCYDNMIGWLTDLDGVVDGTLWSVSEITTAMICANAPVMGPLLRNIFPRWIRVVARSLNPLPTSRFPRTRRTRRTGHNTFAHLESNDRTIDMEGAEKQAQSESVHVEISPHIATAERDLEKSMGTVTETKGLELPKP